MGHQKTISRFSSYTKGDQKSEIHAYREAHQAYLKSISSFFPITFPKSFENLDVTPKVVKICSASCKQVLVLPNASNSLYRVTIKKDQMSSYMNPQVSIDPRTPRKSFEELKNSDVKTLDFKHPIYHMDFCHHTGLGVFFSSPSSDKYLTDEKCD